MKLGKEGWVLRSRGARGADSAFEAGADAARGGRKIYLIEGLIDFRIVGLAKKMDGTTPDWVRRQLDLSWAKLPR